MTGECPHGVFWMDGGTPCRVCEGDAEIANLRASLAEAESRVGVLERAARSLIDREDFWRQAANGGASALPGEYDNLRDILAPGEGT
jgi:hypothetical protein